jgi:hypothetical protein
VPSEPSEKAASLPRLALLDEEFGRANQAAPGLEYQTNRWRWRYVWLLLSSAVLAALSAVFLSNGTTLQAWSFERLLPSSVAAQTAGGSSEMRPVTELDALKKEINVLRHEQQEMSAQLTGLEIAQQELQRSSTETVSWHSEPNALLYHPIAPAPKPRIVALPGKIPQPGAMRGANAEPENRSRPLPLVEPNSATGAPPIRP